VGTVRQGRQSAAKLDDVTIAIVPLIEQLEILNDFVNFAHRLIYMPTRVKGQRIAAAAAREKSVVLGSLHRRAAVTRIPARRQWNRRVPGRCEI
jgi:hypothetical protein